MPPSQLPQAPADNSRAVRIVRIVGTLLLGTASGWLFERAGSPLPWMLGSMSACALAAIANAPVAAPAGVRPIVLPVIGVMLGTSFSPHILGNAANSLITIATMLALMMAAAALGVLYYRRVARLDAPTSFYSGMPGGIMDMAILGEEAGGDARVIALVHAARIAVIVAVVPFVVQFAEHVTLGARVAGAAGFSQTPWSTYLWLAGTAAVGSLLGTLLKLPARHMLGPLILSALVHGSGLTDFIVPREIVNAAQVLLGCVTGCRFAGFARRQVLAILGHSLIVNGLLIGATCAVAYALAPLSPGGFSSLLLAFAAGGLSEMSLVALALHLDIAFVLVHQLIRIAFVVSLAPLAFKMFMTLPQPPNRG